MKAAWPADKGAVHRALLPVLERTAATEQVDIVLVTWSRRAYSAAQRLRPDGLIDNGDPGGRPRWDLGGPNTSKLQAKAKELTHQIRADNLVLFLGAGVSAGVGLPVWQELIDDLARDVGMGGNLAKLHRQDRATVHEPERRARGGA